MVADKINKPVAHAPLEAVEMQDEELFSVDKEAVDPRISAEAVSVCYLHCVLKGLHRAPTIGKGLGWHDVDFLVSANPGQPPQPLAKVASGGELSRISLAIQVITASDGTVPSMVFDEVDVGIGGAVAEVVGRLLRQLAEKAQVLCVTHLPQVAAQGHRHLQVSKSGDKQQVMTQLAALDASARVDEIARMLGGVRITDQTLAHAKEMLESAGS